MLGLLYLLLSGNWVWLIDSKNCLLEKGTRVLMEILQFQSSMSSDEKRGPCRVLEYSTKCFPKILFSDITLPRQHVKMSDPENITKPFFLLQQIPNLVLENKILKLYYTKQEFPGDIILIKGTKPCGWGRSYERKSS